MGISDTVIAKGEEIFNYIPQRYPMVMVDKFFSSDDKSTKTGLTVRKDNIFCENNRLSAAGLVENIAQSAALGHGYACIKEKKSIPIGFIGALKDLKIHYLPEAGKELKTRITVEHQVLNASIVTGVVTSENKKVAECEMKIFIVKEIAL